MTIAEIVKLQAERKFGDRHLVELRDDGFTIAHTDEERASEMLLTDCLLHIWLTRREDSPMPPGIYIYNPLELLPFDLLPDDLD